MKRIQIDTTCVYYAVVSITIHQKVLQKSC
jgi:hypothetical protein